MSRLFSIPRIIHNIIVTYKNGFHMPLEMEFKLFEHVWPKSFDVSCDASFVNSMGVGVKRWRMFHRSDVILFLCPFDYCFRFQHGEEVVIQQKYTKNWKNWHFQYRPKYWLVWTLKPLKSEMKCLKYLMKWLTTSWPYLWICLDPV